MTTEKPFEAENIRRNVLEATQNPSHPNYGRKSSFAHYQLPASTYPKFIALLNAIHATPFDDVALEREYRSWMYRDYKLLIEIHYPNQEKVELLTTEVWIGNFLLAKVVHNQQQHYLVMDNQDMDTLMNYVDPEMTTWALIRPHI